jgi:hypothetical protein
MAECPTCGDEFDTDRDKNVHHKLAHGESLAKSEYECVNCGSVQMELDCDITGERYYCSRECVDEYRDQIPTESQPAYAGRVAVECAYCGEEKEVTPSYFERHERHFCGSGCYGEWLSENVVGKDHPDWKERVVVECIICGEEYEKEQHRVESRPRDLCSRDCLSKWLSKYNSGPAHWQWEGGRMEYGPGFTSEVREEVRAEADCRCEDCAQTQSSHLEETGRKLHVHHICGARRSTNPAVYNAKRNLVALCHDCHLSRWEPAVPGVPGGHCPPRRRLAD